MYDPLISAELVHIEGSDTVTIPSVMGEPQDDQMQGTARERLCELAGRQCYRSMGKGRPSSEYHAHLMSTKHLSVYEHAWFYVDDIILQADEVDPTDILYAFARLRGSDVIKRRGGGFALKFNVRHVYDLAQDQKLSYHFQRYRRSVGGPWDRFIDSMVDTVVDAMPQLALPFGGTMVDPAPFVTRSDVIDRNTHLSLYLSMSRSASHEQVRHRFAVSQVSTRFTDESQSPYITHPMITKYLDSRDVFLDDHAPYDTAVSVLQGAMERDGVPKVHARKQARGAARGFLRNSLHTEMIFTASIEEWLHMISLRMTDAADAEIRVLYNRILETLTAPTVHPDVTGYFNRVASNTRPAIDGVGYVVEG